jgi:hypothetical protein
MLKNSDLKAFEALRSQQGNRPPRYHSISGIIT